MATLKSELARHTIIGLDTNPFIYLFERHPNYFSLTEILFDYLKTPGVQGVTSVITLIETCVQPQRDGRMDLVQIYERALLNSRQKRGWCEFVAQISRIICVHLCPVQLYATVTIL